MKTIHLFRIYHSFLLKKWYLIIYLLFILAALLITLTTIQHVTEDDNHFNIGVVDKDQSSETKLILNSIGKGSNLGKNVSIKAYDDKQAHTLLKKHKLQGYFVFDKGMTKAFYKQGELPISVYTYDQQSMKSVVLSQLTDSVYQRLMRSMGGILAFQDLAPKASHADSINVMTDLLITGLNRSGAFNLEPIHLYDTGSYYAITGFLATVFIFALSLFTVLKMNQDTVLKARLKMFHFSKERLLIIRALITWFYTMLWSIVGVVWIVFSIPNTFELYNWPTLAIHLSYYVTFLILWLLLIELLTTGLLNSISKVILAIFILVLSGLTIPTIFLQHIANGVFNIQPFAVVTNQLLEIILNNYILELHPSFYLSFIALVLIGIGYRVAHDNFKIPITIQDLDQTTASKSFVNKIKQSDYVTIKKVDEDESYIEDDVTKKEAILSMQIPKGFSQKLKENRLKETIQLYGRDDFIGGIAIEIVSSSLYEQQIPNIIYEHLEDMKQHQSIDAINKSYHKHTPESKIKFVSLTKQAQHSISISLIFAVILFVSAVQVVIHYRLNQQAALQRLSQYHLSRFKLYSTYVMTHTILLLLVLLAVSLYLSQPLSLIFYLKSLLLILIYEIGIVFILFHIQTISHRLFMTFIYALAMGIVYLIIFM
ncbi:TPA: ABC transporter permease [Staphylococcus aureus]|nr:ABC transporter permease [Staphylococcus aureus]